jgi:uncharacterized protein YdhG (YjbR/CyaY superfamily)
MSQEVDAYIAAQPAEVRPLLESIRDVIRGEVPEADEVMGYGIPSYKLDGKYLIHFGAAKRHIGLYATPDGHAEFEAELSKYKRGKGSVQLPLDQPLPLDLIKRITRYRVETIRKR